MTRSARHLVRHEPWAVIDIDIDTGNVFVRQDWEYQWQVRGAPSAWTHDEQIAFHTALDRLVWRQWSFKAWVMAKTTGTSSPLISDIVHRFTRGLSLTFDVRRVKTNPHWHITVTKVDPKARPLPQAEVWFDRRAASFYNTDVEPHLAKRYPTDVPSADFLTSPHEFGHTLGRRDEYWPTSPFFNDRNSIMNIGRHVRARHLSLIRTSLLRMLPGCRVRVVVAHR